MGKRRRFFSAFALAALIAVAGLLEIAKATEIRGTISKVEDGGRLQIKLPAGAIARPGDQVRIEAVVPGVGPVEMKARWRVKQVGEGFVIAEPEDRDSGTPQPGHTAIIVTSAPPVTLRPAVARGLAELQMLANGGNVQAMSLLGLYHSGRGAPGDSVPRSIDEAFRWYEKAAAAGDVPAMAALSYLYKLRRGDDAKALEFARKAAAKGDTAAMFALSRLYAEGRGVPRDDVQAFQWTKKAAQGGNEFVAYYLADMYFTGRGTARDNVEAARWWREAADKGIPEAMALLANHYRNGWGVAKDPKQAFEWDLKGAKAGSPVAMSNVALAYLNGAGVAENGSEARRWYERVGNAGNGSGMFALSVIYHLGAGVTANPDLAADWMVRAIEAGSHDAVAEMLRRPWRWNKEFRQALQQRLRSAGVYQGRTDGTFDIATRRAIAALAGRSLSP